MLVAHNRPDGTLCGYAGVPGRQCLKCGAMIPAREGHRATRKNMQPDRVVASPEVSSAKPDNEAKAKRDPEPRFDFALNGEVIEALRQDVRQAPTWLILEVLEARGAEVGHLQIGDVQGCIVLLGPRAHERPEQNPSSG